MALLIYFGIALALSGITLVFRKNVLTRMALYVFLGLQTVLTVYAFMHQGQRELTYFLFDGVSLIFLSVLTILSYTTVYYLSLIHI